MLGLKVSRFRAFAIQGCSCIDSVHCIPHPTPDALYQLLDGGVGEESPKLIVSKSANLSVCLIIVFLFRCGFEKFKKNN